MAERPRACQLGILFKGRGGHIHINTDVMALESLYKAVMRRNSVYIGFIIAGAFVGEKVLNGTIDMMWESSNKGKLYKHLEASLNSEDD